MFNMDEMRHQEWADTVLKIRFMSMISSVTEFRAPGKESLESCAAGPIMVTSNVSPESSSRAVLSSQKSAISSEESMTLVFLAEQNGQNMNFDSFLSIFTTLSLKTGHFRDDSTGLIICGPNQATLWT
jgi:hypothetical protein